MCSELPLSFLLRDCRKDGGGMGEREREREREHLVLLSTHRPLHNLTHSPKYEPPNYHDPVLVNNAPQGKHKLPRADEGAENDRANPDSEYSV